jgi:hypothetical protein
MDIIKQCLNSDLQYGLSRPIEIGRGFAGDVPAPPTRVSL